MITTLSYTITNTIATTTGTTSTTTTTTTNNNNNNNNNNRFIIGEGKEWILYRWIYFGIVCLFALPGCILNIINQQRFDSNLGCNAYSEKLGNWVSVFITELLPISLGYLCNIFVYVKVRSRMSLKSFPLSGTTTTATTSTTTTTSTTVNIITNNTNTTK